MNWNEQATVVKSMMERRYGKGVEARTAPLEEKTGTEFVQGDVVITTLTPKKLEYLASTGLFPPLMELPTPEEVSRQRVAGTFSEKINARNRENDTDALAASSAPKVRRVAIAGGFASGKTTAAKHLVESYGFEILGFATPLYALAECNSEKALLKGFKVEDWIIRYLEPLGYTSASQLEFFRNTIAVMREVPATPGKKNRDLLQMLGTAVGRRLDPDLWVKIWENEVERRGPDARIVNDNLRFPNELESCKKMGFGTIFLDVGIGERVNRYARAYGEEPTRDQIEHESESYLAEMRRKATFVLDLTNASPAEMKRQLNTILTGRHE